MGQIETTSDTDDSAVEALSQAVAARVIDYARDQLYHPPMWKVLVAGLMWIPVALFALSGGLLLAVAGLELLTGSPAVVHEKTSPGFLTLDGYGVTLGIAILLIFLARIQNSLRKRLLRRPQ